MLSLETTFYLRDQKMENVNINNLKVFQLLNFKLQQKDNIFSTFKLLITNKKIIFIIIIDGYIS